MATILIADDESDIREYARSVLERNGHRVLEAASGPAALSVLATEKPDLLLLDVMLPGMDGHTLQMHLSSDERLKNLPVIVVTALDFTQEMFAKFPQVKGFLAKPFSPVQLDQAVRQVVPTPSL
ncbi:MAG: response regulator [Elusimicrobia bacterium]|nr:response regulator [Elusimicrobiota bacterium]